MWPEEGGCINTEAVIAKAAASVYKAIAGAEVLAEASRASGRRIQAKKAEAVVEKAARASAAASRQRVEEEGSKAGSAYKRMGGGKEGCTRVEEEGSKAGSAYTRVGGESAGARLLAKAAASAGANKLWAGAAVGIKRRRTDADAAEPTWLLCPAPQPITSMLLSVCFLKICLWITSELLVCSSCALSILYASLGCVVRVCI